MAFAHLHLNPTVADIPPRACVLSQHITMDVKGALVKSPDGRLSARGAGDDPEGPEGFPYVTKGDARELRSRRAGAKSALAAQPPRLWA